MPDTPRARTEAEKAWEIRRPGFTGLEADVGVGSGECIPREASTCFLGPDTESRLQ